LISSFKKFPAASSLWVVLVILLGFTLRMWMPLRGFNYDIESWKIAADILAEGGNVYGQTGRYNYGPIWFYVLNFLDQLPFTGVGHFLAFRWKVAIFLSCIDIAIFLVLLRLYGLLVASLFFLNPISIIITGYHSQMDNFALLLGLFAVLVIEHKRQSWGLLPGLAILGLSLITKHFLIFFPIWIAFKEQRWSRKIMVVVVPYSIFLLSFLPYWSEGSEGILRNVFLYRSVTNAPFWNVFAPNILLTLLPPIILFVGTLMLLGLIWRKKSLMESFNYYLICVVIFSSAVMNQYFSISLPAIATQWNWAYSLFTAFTTLYLTVDWAGLHFGIIQNTLGWQGKYGYNAAITLLFIGFSVHLIGKPRHKKLCERVHSSFLEAKKIITDQLKAPW
jgi:hypothetical protein